MISKLFVIYEISSGAIDYKIKGDEIKLSIEKAMPIALIVNEIVSNSLKYAFQDREQGLITIDLIHSGVTYSIVIHDDGCGFDYDPNASRASLGLDLVKNLVLQLNGTCSVKNECGTKFILEFPANVNIP